uniref:Uncharacterized protein n=1 Tax=Arundo donax TaxID=35708 RepID=A0A0A9G1N8_ARUDO
MVPVVFCVCRKNESSRLVHQESWVFFQEILTC